MRQWPKDTSYGISIGGIFKAVLFLLTSWCLPNKLPRHRPVIIAAALVRKYPVTTPRIEEINIITCALHWSVRLFYC